jgi:hypothetical protein
MFVSNEDIQETLKDIDENFIKKIKKIDLSSYNNNMESIRKEIDKIKDSLKNIKQQ